MTFSENSYFSEFKKVRNKFRKYNHYDLVNGALSYINKPSKTKIESIERQPWLAMLFIKWVLLDNNFPNARGKRADINKVISLLQMVLDLTAKTRMPSDYGNLMLFMRNIAYQQFVYQIDFDYSNIARQSILFGSLDDNHYINKSFYNNYGLSIKDALDLCFVTVIRFLDKNEIILPLNWYSNLEAQYPAETIKNFFGLITKSIFEARNDLKSRDDGKRRSSEIYEQTPFLRYPLIQTTNGCLLTHKAVLYRCIDHFVYDKLREYDAAGFMEKFGDIFERYIENVIKYAEVKYYAEDEIKLLLGVAGNQIDFIIQEQDANIFIDAKAVEMNHHGKTTHSAKILRDKTKQSIYKAIKQSHDVMQKIEHKKEGINRKPYNYLLVITYKELNMGNGVTYYDIIAKDKMDEMYHEYDVCIPPENIYFMTVDQFDVVMGAIKDKKTTLQSLIERAKEDDKNVETKKFDFKQHIMSIINEPLIPKFIIDEKDRLFERISAPFL